MSHDLRRVALSLVVVVVATLAWAGPAVAGPALWEGLVANWTFDETSGTTAVDNVNGANAEWLPPGDLGTYGQSWVTGRLGGALAFDPAIVHSGALVGNAASLNLGTNAFTIASWVKFDELPSGTTSDDFAAVFDSQLDNYVMYADRAAAEIRSKFYTSDSGGTAAIGTGKPGAGEVNLDTTNWHHCVVTFDGAFSRFYINGQLAELLAVSNPAGTQVRPNQVVGIGYQPKDASVASSYDRCFLKGAVDDMAVWNRPINANEVSYLYNGGAGQAVKFDNPTIAAPVVTMPTPIVHFEFENNLTNSGSGLAAYNGTIVDGSLGSTSYVAGKIGNGLQFTNPHSATILTDGDYMSTPYVMTNEGTLSFFVKPGEWFNWLSIFDNSGSAGSAGPGNDWEMWIDAGGFAKFRLKNGSSSVAKDLDLTGGPNVWHHIAVSWSRALGQDTAAICLYVNGVLAGGADGGWIDPGSEFYIAGGNAANSPTTAAYDDLRIYDVALTPDQVKYLNDLGNPAIPGDTDNDGDVDNFDAQKLATNWGSTVTGKAADGDFNEDGVVNAADASILAANWTGTLEGSSAVPEPSVLVLLLASSAVLLLRRRG